MKMGWGKSASVGFLSLIYLFLQNLEHNHNASNWLKSQYWLTKQTNKNSRKIIWMLMTWRHKEPGHQQPCYWLDYSSLITRRVNIERSMVYVPSLLTCCRESGWQWPYWCACLLSGSVPVSPTNLVCPDEASKLRCREQLGGPPARGHPWNYRKVSNISHTLVGNKIVDRSDVVGESPVGAAPTTSSFST